jgi:hypothetical protein
MVRAQDFTSLTLKKWLTPKESSYFLNILRKFRHKPVFLNQKRKTRL